MRLITAAFLTLSLTLPAWGGIMQKMNHSEKIKYVFNHLSSNNMSLVDEFYHPNVVFIDPIGSHVGMGSVKKYYEGLYKNVKFIKFDFSKIIEEKQTVVAIWKMTLLVDRLNGGKPIVVEGNSVITFHDNDQVIYHRDYFDMGEFIYEKIPVFGFIIKKIKNQMKKQN